MSGLKKGVAFKEGNSYYHRIKILNEDGTVKYSKKGGYATPEEAEAGYLIYDTEFKEAQRRYQMTHKVDSNIGLYDYLIYWFEELFSQRIENTTRMVGAYTLYHLIEPHLNKDIKLKHVTTDYLDEVLLLVSKETDNAGNKAREFLNMAFKEAMTQGYITSNPMLQTKAYPRKKPRVLVLSKEKLKVLLKAASDNEWYLEILLALFCGLRKGEILGLKFSDFNLDKRTVSIERQITGNPIVSKGSAEIEHYGVIEKQPKTENSYRTLRVPNVIIDEIQKRRERISSYKMKASDNFLDHNYISCQKNGLPHSASAMNTALTKLCNRNSLPHITVHSLRHMYATILLERGVELVKISALLGHSSINTTYSYYCEQMDENEHIISFMNSQFSPKGEQEFD